MVDVSKTDTFGDFSLVRHRLVPSRQGGATVGHVLVMAQLSGFGATLIPAAATVNAEMSTVTPSGDDAVFSADCQPSPLRSQTLHCESSASHCERRAMSKGTVSFAGAASARPAGSIAICGPTRSA